MNRRSFFGKALALASIAVLPKVALAQSSTSVTDALVNRLRRNENILHESFVLDKPLVIDFPTTSKIAYCHIDGKSIKNDAVVTIAHDEASLEFLGNYLHADPSSYVIKIVKSTTLFLTDNTVSTL